jgi:hypothetical protein
MDREYLTRKQASEYLGELGLPTSIATLETWVTRSGGPPYAKWGRRCIYPRNELLAWATARISPLRKNSSEADARENVRRSERVPVETIL